MTSTQENKSNETNNKCPSIKLNDDTTIPVLGFGTYKLKGQSGTEAIAHALKVGYRHLDSAIFYDNQQEVGNAINSQKDLTREDLYITTKLWGDDHGRQNTIKAVTNSLKEFNMKYINLYLIHSPIGGKNIETFLTLKEYQSKGYIKSIGVSNYGTQHLKELKKNNLLPVINQIELHPWLQQEAIVNYCNNNNIIVEAYSPLTKGKKLSDKNKIDKRLLKLSDKYKKDCGQILIKWSLQNNFVCLVKSSKKKRISNNFDMFNWNISKEDMNILKLFEEDYHCTWDPTTEDIKDF